MRDKLHSIPGYEWFADPWDAVEAFIKQLGEAVIARPGLHITDVQVQKITDGPVLVVARSNMGMHMRFSFDLQSDGPWGPNVNQSISQIYQSIADKVIQAVAKSSAVLH